MVPLAVGNLLERPDCVGEARDLAGLAGEHLGHEERLRQETLHAAGPVHHEFVLLRQFIDAEDGDDVLQFAVSLQRPLHAAGNLVVPLAHVLRIEDAARRGERIDGRIDALLGDRTLQVEEGVEVAERRRRRWVGRVVSGDVDGLYRSDGPLRRGCDPFLKGTHLRGKRRLIAHGARHAAKECAHLAACL